MGGERKRGEGERNARKGNGEEMLCHSPPSTPPTLWQLTEAVAERSHSPVVNEEAVRTLNQSEITEQESREELRDFNTAVSRREKGAKRFHF